METREVTIDLVNCGQVALGGTVRFQAVPGSTSGSKVVLANVYAPGGASVTLMTDIEILVTLPDKYQAVIVIPDGGTAIALSVLLATSTPPTNETLAAIADAIEAHNADPEAHAAIIAEAAAAAVETAVTNAIETHETDPEAHSEAISDAVDAGVSAHNASTAAHSALTAFNGQTVTNPTYTLAATDDRKYIHCNRGAGVTVTLPNNLAVGLTVEVVQTGDGQVTFSAGSGATLRHPDSHAKTRSKYSVVALRVISNSNDTSAEYLLSGDTAA